VVDLAWLRGDGHRCGGDRRGKVDAEVVVVSSTWHGCVAVHVTHEVVEVVVVGATREEVVATH